MRALVVYEPVNGNARVVAAQVADGLRATHEVTLVSVTEVTVDLLAGTDLLVVGAPAHRHGLSSGVHDLLMTPPLFNSLLAARYSYASFAVFSAGSIRITLSLNTCL